MKIPLFKKTPKLIDLDNNGSPDIAVIEHKGEPNGWLKLLLPMIPLAAAGLIGYGALRSDVDTVKTKTAELDKQTVAINISEAESRVERAEIKQTLLEIKELIKELREDQKDLRRQLSNGRKR
jgi:hypothetical protein